MTNTIKNMAASVHDRLLAQAKQDTRPFNELLQYFAMDRFLYRWGLSPHAEVFVLKGALMLKVWKASEIRPTMDIDMLGKMKNDEESIVAVIKDVISLKVDPDGLVFHPDSVKPERITEDADYEGIRVNFLGTLGNAQINMQVDIGFGDVIYPDPVKTILPPMLNFPSAELLCYSRESSIAEKFEAAVSLGDVNSRMKDFFDIRTLSRQFDFDGMPLAEAISRTFKRRGTQLPDEGTSFTQTFVESKQIQWNAFRKKLDQEHIPASFAEVIVDVERFLQPIAKAIVTESPIPKKWNASGSWS